MVPRWAKLLDRYQLDGHVGLTPSFLVGALREPVGAILDAPSSFAELQRLLDSMRVERAPYGRIAKVFECQNLRQPVVALSTDTHGTGLGKPGQPARLYVWPWYQPERPVEFDWLVQALWCHFRGPICEGRFSYQRATRLFTEFDENDLMFIEKALKTEDDA